MGGWQGLLLSLWGWQELLVVLVIVVIIFGGAKLAGLGKASGRAIREFKDELQGTETVANATSSTPAINPTPSADPVPSASADAVDDTQSGKADAR